MFEIIEGDLEPDLELTITVDGVAQDLSSATDLVLHWLQPDGTIVDVDLTEVDLTTGQVKYVWTEGDTDTVGYHKGRVVVTWPSGDAQTFPNDGSWHIWAVYSKDR